MDECQWFHGCHNPFYCYVEHPTIGDVAICSQHLEWVMVDPSPTKMIPPIVARSMEQVGR